MVVSKSGPRSDVVHRLLVGLGDVVQAVGAEAEEALGSPELAHRPRGQVVLADVEAVGAGEKGHVEPVVDQDRHAVTRRALADVVDPLEEIAVRHVRLADLQELDPGLERLFEDVEGIVQAELLGQEQIDAGILEPLSRQPGIEGHGAPPARCGDQDRGEPPGVLPAQPVYGSREKGGRLVRESARC